MANKATRFNRRMSMASAVFAIILLGCVFGMLYFSFQNVKEKDKIIPNMYSLRFDSGFCDSVTVAINDSVVFTGIANDTLFIGADGNNVQNMIMVEDKTESLSLNQDLPQEPSAVVISKNKKLEIQTMKILAPGTN